MKKLYLLIFIVLFGGNVFSQTYKIKQNDITHYKLKHMIYNDSISESDSIKIADSIARIYNEIEVIGEKEVGLPEEIYIEKGNIDEKAYPTTTTTQNTEIIPKPIPAIPRQNQPIHTTQISNIVSIMELKKSGQINYVIKDTMVVNQTNEVNLTISSNIDLSKIIEDIETFNEHNLQTDTIPISGTMRARLIDPSGENFRIVPMTESEQFLTDGEYTLWKWNVTPLTQGNNKLSISVDIVVNDKSKLLKVYDGVIYVYSDETFLHKVWVFILQYLEFIVGTILIPVIIFIYSSVKKKRKN